MDSGQVTEDGKWGVIGNERAVAAVRRAVLSASPPHGYLFVGPERVGKATLALRLAQALNCKNLPPHPVGQGPSPDTAPCGKCTPCRRIEAGIHSDVQTVSIEPDGPQRKAISIEQMREVERAVSLKPFEGRTRVVTVDPADDMTTEAQNAFLKTLEEPPPHVVFVLIARQEERLLPTIRSRCQRIEFRLLPVAEVERALAAAGVDAGQARLLARLSQGRSGWALEMAREPSQLETRKRALESARALVRMSVGERLDLAERLADDFKLDRERVFSLLREWQGWWRDVLRVQSGAEEGVANLDMLSGLHEDALIAGRREVLEFVGALVATRQHLGANVQARLALEALLLAVPRSALKAWTR